jgi:hypothetical protein
MRTFRITTPKELRQADHKAVFIWERSTPLRRSVGAPSLL